MFIFVIIRKAVLVKIYVFSEQFVQMYSVKSVPFA